MTMVGSNPPPPRFIPTLTEVVQLPDDAVLAVPVVPDAVGDEHGDPPHEALLDETDMPSRAPEPARELEHEAPTTEEPPFAAPAQQTGEPPALPALNEEALIHRVMQRVDVQLQERMQASLNRVVAEQMRPLLGLLHQEVEALVRECVSQAVAQELDAALSGAPAAPPD